MVYFCNYIEYFLGVKMLIKFFKDNKNMLVVVFFFLFKLLELF